MVDIALKQEEAYRELFKRIGEKQVQAHLPLKGTPAPFLYVLDSRVIAFAAVMLREVKRQLPHHPLWVFTSLSARDLIDTRVQEGLRVLYELHSSSSLSERSRLSVMVDW